MSFIIEEHPVAANFHSSLLLECIEFAEFLTNPSFVVSGLSQEDLSLGRLCQETFNMPLYSASMMYTAGTWMRAAAFLYQQSKTGLIISCFKCGQIKKANN